MHGSVNGVSRGGAARPDSMVPKDMLISTPHARGESRVLPVATGKLAPQRGVIARVRLCLVHLHFFASELQVGASCFSSRTSSGKLSATNITAAVTSPTVIPSHQ
jgi:hypothetical protein